MIEELSMADGTRLGVIEIKAFVPAKDFDLSKAFSKDIGFTMASEGGGIAYFHFENASFLLQDLCTQSLAKDFTMHMLVFDVDAWWSRINDSGVVAKYGVRLTDIEVQPWRMRNFFASQTRQVLSGALLRKQSDKMPSRTERMPCGFMIRRNLFKLRTPIYPGRSSRTQNWPVHHSKISTYPNAASTM
jgi:hypothetical protein